ncbi:MAG: hypothetical protein WC825_00285 [Gallionellaceae bacterium]
MSEQPQSHQQPAQNKTGTDSGTFRAMLRTPGHNPLVNLISHLNITQMTLAVLVVVFVWQWFDAHYQINQVQQELAKRLAEMDGTTRPTRPWLPRIRRSCANSAASSACWKANMPRRKISAPRWRHCIRRCRAAATRPHSPKSSRC